MTFESPAELISRFGLSGYLGLAPFLRLSLAGVDLRPIAQAFLGKAGESEDPCLWMNMATAFFSIGEAGVAQSMQDQALLACRLFRHEPAPATPRFRLLVLAAPGDIAENTPIDCLLEGEPVELTTYFATPGQLLPDTLPDHDAVLVAVCDRPRNRPLLAKLEQVLEHWEKPVLNRPGRIPHTERGAASELLRGIPGLCMPATRQIVRPLLEAVAGGKIPLAAVAPDCAFPIILRPLGSHGGRDLERIDSAAEIPDYLARVDETTFYIAPFIDYRSADGLYRKFRIALVDGQPYICHVGVSAHWMIHYVNAGMYEDAGKREEEARFMANFDAFAERHRNALEGLWQRAGLDYFCIDCAETASGELLIFEIDHAMVVHAMDSESLFPYKQGHMQKVRQAFERMLSARIDCFPRVGHR